jgi:biopolymer transport protein ExbD
VINLTREGEALLEGRVMDDEELRSALRDRLRNRPERIVFFRGDPQARYGRAVAVLDIAREAGARILGAVVRTGGEDGT